jgi:hypothetical protein
MLNRSKQEDGSVLDECEPEHERQYLERIRREDHHRSDPSESRI